VWLYPVVCGADAMLLCRRRRREQLQDVELDKERESGKKTGKLVGKPEMGRESCYLYQNPVFPTYGSTWSERTGCGVQNPVFPSKIQFFLRPVMVMFGSWLRSAVIYHTHQYTLQYDCVRYECPKLPQKKSSPS
jgi:hypothetical protein